MTMTSMTNEHNKTDFKLMGDIEDLKLKLLLARNKIKELEKATAKRLKTVQVLKEGKNKIVKEIDFWIGRHKSVKQERDDRTTEVNVMSAAVNQKYFENIYLKDQVERLKKDCERYQKENLKLNDIVKTKQADSQNANMASG